MEMQNEQKRLWAEISIDALEHNYRTNDFNKCCVVKANAYGHGAVQISKICENLGADFFAVSNIEEAIQIRKSGIKTNILILGYTPVDCANLLEKYDIHQAVYNYEYAKGLNDTCIKYNSKVKIHIKIDTGMGRIGFQFHNGVNELSLALESCKLSNLITIGIFTHFAISDEGINDFTYAQYDYFVKAISFLESNNIKFQFKHCSNSAAIIDYPKFKMDMVRMGISLYGIDPTLSKKTGFKPVLSLWSVVSNVKTVHKGDSVSYGRTYIANEDTIVATVPIGYADGFWRSNQGHHVYIDGEYCEIIGRVCMDQIMVKCKNVRVGDLVEIYGEHVTIDDVANYNHTIPYEILCAIGERVPRVYKKNGEIVEIVDKLIK